jgi:hypothetical protein
VLLQKPGKHETSAKGQNRERYRQINEGKPAETYRKENQSDRQSKAGHLQPNKPALGRAMQTHDGARNERKRYSAASH